MGHGIKVVEVKFNQSNNTYRVVRKCTTLYLSYNWTDLKDTWGVKQHMHAKKTPEVIASLKAAIQKLEMAGIPLGKDDPENLNWSYGTTMEDREGKTQRLPEIEHKSIFRFHLERFVAALTPFPEAWCFTDSAYPADNSITLDGVKYTEEEEVEEDDAMVDVPAVETKRVPKPYDNIIYYMTDSKTGCPYTYMSDKIKGHIEVRTFADAMAISGSMRAQGDQVRAEAWYQFGLDCWDAPAART